MPAIVPVVTPMWCPVPMAMYAKPYPVPVPIPIPIPVPIFIPTSRNTARGVEKCIKKIRYILLVVSLDHRLAALLSPFSWEGFSFCLISKEKPMRRLLFFKSIYAFLQRLSSTYISHRSASQHPNLLLDMVLHDRD